MSFISFEHVKREYQVGDMIISAISDINFEIEKGEMVVVVGQSGAGKTTVLNLLGGMDSVTGGKIIVDGSEISKYNQKQLTEYRRYDIGFVFQFYNLVANLTALENVELSTQIANSDIDPIEVLKGVGLGERTNNFPGQLSGGEQQRVSIARALAKKPKIMLCDEPTGALDYMTGKQVLGLLQDFCRKKGMTVIIVTHNLALMPMADRVIKMKNGKVYEIAKNPYPIPIEEIEW